MATTRLSIYNNALFLLGERQLTSEYENVPSRKVLDEAWALNIVEHCLEMAKPKFALTTAKLATPVVSSVHSLDNVYDLPSDYLSIYEVYSDEAMQNKIDRYLIEGRTIATEVATNIYLRYVTGTIDYSKWTPGFSRLVAAYLASQTAIRIAPDKVDDADKAFKDQLGAVLEVESIIEPGKRPLKAIRTLDTHWTRVYNGVLQLLGQPLITGNTDQSPARIALDYAVGASKEGLLDSLEMVKPRFAMKTAALTGGSASAVHGYTEVHALPADYLCIVGLYSDTKLDQTVNRYLIDGTNLNCTYDPVYLRYIQNAPADTAWSPTFFRYFCAHLAVQIMAEHTWGETATERETRRATIKRQHDELLQFVLQNEAWKEPERRATASEFVLTDAWRAVYNHALQLLKLPPIINNSDDSERRYALDVAVNDNVVGTVMEQIAWNIAKTRVKLTYDDPTDKTFGYAYRYDLPADFWRMDVVSTDESFYTPADYIIEGAYIYSDSQILYVSYMTNALLTTPGSWPVYFRNLVAAEMAIMASWLPGADQTNAERKRQRYWSEAASTDASRNPPRPIRTGTWVRARGSDGNWGIDNGRFRPR